MKIVITGDRNWGEWREPLIEKTLAAYPDAEFILGGAKGVDKRAQKICVDKGYKFKLHFAQWDKYGKAAGPIRNNKMLLEEPALVIYFHDKLDESKGTKDCVEKAKKANIPVKSYMEVIRGSNT